jgi:pilus assembly protein CpaB
LNPDRKRLFFAAGAGLLAALLAWAWLASLEQRLLHQGQEIRILAVRRYVPAQARLQAADLRWRSMPRAFAPTGAITQPEQALGLQTLVPFSEDEPLVLNKLALGEQSLAAAVPPGQRALSLPVNAVTGLSGLVKPGDHVDVLLLHGQGPQSQAGLLLQDATVLAVGAHLGRESVERSDRGGTVTLALDPAEAALALAAQANGALTLTLRAPGDDRPSGGARAGFADALRRLAEAPARIAAPRMAPANASATDADFVPQHR